MNRTLKGNASLAALAVLSALTPVYTPAQTPDSPRPLPAGQALEREISGNETHRYSLSLRKDEFFQARVEQKGVDVTLKLLDGGGNVLAAMDSPNSKEGPETLSFVAPRPGTSVLEVSVPEAKAEKGSYTIRRQGPRRATAQDRRRVEIEHLFTEGMAARNVQGQSEKALSKLEQALKGWRELGDGYLSDLTERQVKQIRLQPKITALIADFNLPQNLVSEGHTLMREGRPESVPAAREKFTQAVAAARAFFKRLDDESLGDILSKENRADWKMLTKMSEVNALGGISSTYTLTKDWGQSVRYGEKAVTAIREMSRDPEIGASKALTSFVPLRALEASQLSAVASTFTSRLDKPQEGLSYAGQAVTLWREVQRDNEKYRTYAEFQEALSLQSMAQSYLALDDRKNAAECFEQALTIFRRVPEHKSLAASMLLQLGTIRSRQLDYEKARGAWGEAVKIYEGLGDKPSQAGVMQQIGLSYFNVGDEQKAREYFNRALAILLSDDYLESSTKSSTVMPPPGSRVDVPDLSAFQKNEREWERSVGVGNIYTILGDNDKGREHYEKSLAPARALKGQSQLRLSLSFIGNTYEGQKRWQEALDYYGRALEISRQLPGKSDLAGDLCNVAYIQIEQKSWADALRNAAEALLVYQSLGADKNNLFVGYAGALNLLARAQDGLGNRRLAIFYEKQAVNAIQRERQQLKNLDGQAQRGYLKKNEKPYRRLAEWLVAEGRLPEAEQVLAMLKEEEVFDYLRRDASETDRLRQRADLSPQERDALTRYNVIAGRVAAIGAELDELLELKRQHVEFSPEQSKRFEELSKESQDANNIFQAFLKQLADEFAKRPDVRSDLQENLGIKSDLRSWGGGVVFLYTLVGEDRYRVILTTRRAQTDGKTEIRAADLNDKIRKFRAAVQDPSVDPRPLGKELYDIIIKPVEKELEGAKAKTLLWSLDGSMRLLPLAALWDGRQYFGQKYQNVTVTLASRTRLGEAVVPGWRALGLGVSQPKTITVTEPGGTRGIHFAPLPAVRAELASIVRHDGSPRGLLPGQILLDTDFSEAGLKKELPNGYQVVHIASHFSLNPGDSTQSFLVLGDGQVLTLNELKTSEELSLEGVELLTLSACETAVVGKDVSGKEAEGFGYVAQQKGAKAILATLWAVADESTQVLMSEFYRLRKENPRLTKAEALQTAQREMIEGRLSPPVIDGRARGAEMAGGVAQGREGAMFSRDKSKPYAHPYYWAPFVLIGNWK